MSGAVQETYVAAIQHNLTGLEGDETFVGVVREPTRWFHTAVNENRPELGPQPALRKETTRRTLRAPGFKPVAPLLVAMSETGRLETMEPNPVWTEEAYADTVDVLASLDDEVTYKIWGGDW